MNRTGELLAAAVLRYHRDLAELHRPQPTDQVLLVGHGIYDDLLTGTDLHGPPSPWHYDLDNRMWLLQRIPTWPTQGLPDRQWRLAGFTARVGGQL